MSIEQGIQASPRNMDFRFARAIGRAVGTIEFGVDQVLDQGARFGGVIFQRLMTLDPFATNTFHISDELSRNADMDVLCAAVKRSSLPEGVHLVTAYEEDPPKPYVVITFSPTWDEARRVLNEGAMNYVSGNTSGVKELALKLSGKEF